MQQRALGQTGLRVSPIGYGAFKIGRNQGIKYEAGYDLPDEPIAARLLNEVLDLGISHIDTAPAYGLSEERIGRAISHRRHEFVLSTKVGETFTAGQPVKSHYDFSRNSIRASIFRSLAHLRTDILDIVLIHAPADDLRTLTETPAFETLQSLKAAGHIRAIGLSARTSAAASHAFDWADILMLEYHPLDTTHSLTIAAAVSHNLGILIKKPLASGRLTPSESIPFLLSTPGISSLTIGGLSLDHLAANVQIAESVTVNCSQF